MIHTVLRPKVVDTWTVFPFWHRSLQSRMYSAWTVFPFWHRSLQSRMYSAWTVFPFWHRSPQSRMYSAWTVFPFWHRSLQSRMYSAWTVFPFWHHSLQSRMYSVSFTQGRILSHRTGRSLSRNSSVGVPLPWCSPMMFTHWFLAHYTDFRIRWVSFALQVCQFPLIFYFDVAFSSFYFILFVFLIFFQ